MARILTAIVVLPVLLASIWYAPLTPLFGLLAMAAMLLGLYEFWMLAKCCNTEPDVVLGITTACLITACFYFGMLEQLLPIVSAFTIVALAMAVMRGMPFDRLLASVGATALGVLYVAVLGGHLIAVRTNFPHPRGAQLLSFFLLVVMGSDTAAYYTGRAIGRRKLAPTISPGKTWEGAAGGMAASVCAAVIAHYWFFPELQLSVGIPLAAVMNVLGVAGDLTESALKRGAGAKDAANVLPGHGGLLDRLDSLLFNAPVIYYFGRFYFR